MLAKPLSGAAIRARNWWTLIVCESGLNTFWKRTRATWQTAPAPKRVITNEASTTKIESLRKALEADDYDAMAQIIRHLDWEGDCESRHQLAEWIESGELVLVRENGKEKLRRRGHSPQATELSYH